MASFVESAADPRSTDELFAAAWSERDHDWENGRIQLPALSSLQARSTPEVLDGAIELLGSSDSDERLLGVSVLAELCEIGFGYVPAAVDRSVTALLDRAEVEYDDEVTAQIARALGYRQDSRGLPTLMRWLEHEDEHVRFYVACALPGCATAQTEDLVAAALIQLTRDDDGDVRDYALFGFPQLSIDTPEIRDAILVRTTDEDWSAAGQALVNLARLGDRRVIEPLVDYLQTRMRGPYGYEASAAIADPALIPLLRTAIPADGYAEDLARAITACETQTPYLGWDWPLRRPTLGEMSFCLARVWPVLRMAGTTCRDGAISRRRYMPARGQNGPRQGQLGARRTGPRRRRRILRRAPLRNRFVGGAPSPRARRCRLCDQPLPLRS